MYSVSDVNNCAKPDPALYIHTTTKLNVSPTVSIAIEDSAHGIRAAKQAGLFCIGLNSGKNKALLYEADYIVECHLFSISGQCGLEFISCYFFVE